MYIFPPLRCSFECRLHWGHTCKLLLIGVLLTHCIRVLLRSSSISLIIVPVHSIPFHLISSRALCLISHNIPGRMSSRYPQLINYNVHINTLIRVTPFLWHPVTSSRRYRWWWFKLISIENVPLIVVAHYVCFCFSIHIKCCLRATTEFVNCTNRGSYHFSAV